MTAPNAKTEFLERKAEREFTETEVASNSVEQGRSLVVVIGINEYIHWQKLKNAVQDAVGLQQTLIDKLGFSAPIPPLLNEAATKAAITFLIEDQLREEVQKDDSLVLFFAGHGHTRVDKAGDIVLGETGFIIPAEARGPKEVWSDYIQIDPLLQSISWLPARHILVILDSCHSGFALGEAMKSFRDAVRYEKDLSSRLSRKVITSARREQLALDNGPIPGHSLFTGTLVDGFNWGKADLDGNGLITSSELGLFIQQKVGQTSESKQTPDFGSFYLDDRGEMVISLRNQSFDALKARAFSALQSRELKFFKERVEELIALNPSSPESLYLEYRLRFAENDFERVVEIINTLLSLNLSNGLIPLSQEDLWDIEGRLYCWASVFSITETTFPVQVNVLVRDAGGVPDKLENAEKIRLGDVEGYRIEHRKVFRLSLTNTTSHPLHIYMVEIDSNGYFQPIILWKEEDILFDGLPPGETKLSYPFVQTGSTGTCEIRLFASPKRLKFFLFPASPGARGSSIELIEEEDLTQIKMKPIYYSMTSKL
ncbi:caspase family protein [Leptolyngbya sp. ST-U4]|uniref:caspase family protein n=1 Tax=Leptolyngbya sp. ST-U4 TaxID=2933912 RepID=UPI003299CFA1